MKTYKQFMEQSSHGAVYAKRASNASAAEKADKKSEKIVAATNKKAPPLKVERDDDSGFSTHTRIRRANSSQVRQVAGDVAAAIR